MNTTSERRIGPALPAPPADVQLVSWPLRDEPLRAWPAAAGCLLVVAVAWWASDSLFMAALSLATLGLALWRMWLPVTYRLESRGVLQIALGRTWRTFWRDIAQGRVYRDGVLLLPTDDNSPLAAMRGIFVPWARQREAVLAVVEYYLARSIQRDSSVIRRME